MKCMLQRDCSLILFSGVAQKNDWKMTAFVRNAIRRSFWIFLVSLPCTGRWKSGSCCCTAAVVGPSWNGMVAACRSRVWGGTLPAALFSAWETCATQKSLPVQCHHGEGEPALTSLSFCPSCLNGRKEGLLQKEGPSLFSAVVLCPEHKKNAVLASRICLSLRLFCFPFFTAVEAPNVRSWPSLNSGIPER